MADLSDKQRKAMFAKNEQPIRLKSEDVALKNLQRSIADITAGKEVNGFEAQELKQQKLRKRAEEIKKEFEKREKPSIFAITESISKNLEKLSGRGFVVETKPFAISGIDILKRDKTHPFTQQCEPEDARRVWNELSDDDIFKVLTAGSLGTLDGQKFGISFTQDDVKRIKKTQYEDLDDTERLAVNTGIKELGFCN